MIKSIAIIQGCGSNIASVLFALQRLGETAFLTANPNEIKNASHVILPGVGSADYAMQQLRKSQLDLVIPNLTQPVLGICLGMQLMFESSEEGDVDCLRILKGKIAALPEKLSFTIPHMGWNQISITDRGCPLLKDIIDQSYFYFVHKFAASLGEYTKASTQHSHIFSSIVQHKNFFAVQFHPERSGVLGTQLLKNFLEIKS